MATAAEKNAEAKRPRWHRYVPTVVDGEQKPWCKECGAAAGADWHRYVPQAGDPPSLGTVLQKLEWCTGDFSVTLKPAEAAMLVPIVRAHLGRPPAAEPTPTRPD